MKAVGKKSVKAANSAVNTALLIIIAALIAFAGYALWDSKQIYRAADKSNYAIYKPTIENEGMSFKELQAINEEVFAWLTVYGTNIDYPVTQGPDNMKYVNTNAEGRYTLSGAIFLDYHNSKDFSDFNSILYGHHMEKKTMFGEIGEFKDRDIFDARRYGNLYFDEISHGLEFFAFLHVDAYDTTVFTADVKEGARQEYLDNLLALAMHRRDIGVSADDHIVLLSTCSASTTNGRDILVGRLTDEVFEDSTHIAEPADDTGQAGDSQDCLVREVPPMLLPIAILAVLLILTTLRFLHRLNNINSKRRAEANEQDAETDE